MQTRTRALNLREAVMLRDEEDTDADYRHTCDQVASRLDLAAAFAARSGPDLVARLRAVKHTALGQPSQPFMPKIHTDAADAIEELQGEQGGCLDGKLTNEQFLDLASRLLGLYGIGPVGQDGRPEFGVRLTWTDELGIEAAGRICALAPDLGMLLGVFSAAISTDAESPSDGPGTP